jgi:hypothetical protein
MAAYVVFNTTLLELKKEKKQKTFFFVMHPLGESCSGRVFDFETGVHLLGNQEKMLIHPTEPVNGNVV